MQMGVGLPRRPWQKALDFFELFLKGSFQPVAYSLESPHILSVGGDVCGGRKGGEAGAMPAL